MPKEGDLSEQGIFIHGQWRRPLSEPVLNAAGEVIDLTFLGFDPPLPGDSAFEIERRRFLAGRSAVRKYWFGKDKIIVPKSRCEASDIKDDCAKLPGTTFISEDMPSADIKDQIIAMKFRAAEITGQDLKYVLCGRQVRTEAPLVEIPLDDEPPEPLIVGPQ